LPKQADFRSACKIEFRLRLRLFLTLDVFAGYKIRKNVEIFAAAENVFNSRYDIGLTPNRVAASPVFLRTGLRLNLGKN
jgi:outer membrane receptor protein involved in Fe transport